MKEEIKNIGKTATYTINGLQIEVKITDVRTPWGRIDYEIEPVHGKGSVWVKDDSIRIIN